MIGIALVLALALTLCFSTVALAWSPATINTDWDIDGSGVIGIDTTAYTFNQTVSDDLFVGCGNGSVGHNYTGIRGGAYHADRFVLVGNGIILNSIDGHSWWGGRGYSVDLGTGSNGYAGLYAGVHSVGGRLVDSTFAAGGLGPNSWAFYSADWNNRAGFEGPD